MSITQVDRDIFGVVTCRIVCDRCGTAIEVPSLIPPGISDEYWTDEAVLEDVAHYNDWQFQRYHNESDGHHVEEFLCPDCPLCEDSEHSWEPVAVDTATETRLRCASCGWAPHAPLLIEEAVSA
jgi:hypothetical protein